LKCQLRESGYDVDKAFRIEVRNSFVWRVFERSNKDCAEYILMMANIKESDSTITVTLDIPGGKRRLGESALKAAVREMYEETFVQIRRGDLELIFGTETDKVYKVTV
jgi:ADP-ribose pyrophosphatase YjhB (NUDIX family)